MEIRYKLTDKNNQTYNNTQWGENITHETNGKGELCSGGWLHCYSDPFLALLLNPIHANFVNPILWECEVSGISKSDYGLKEGWTKMTTIKQLPLPEITLINHIAFGILCVLEVYSDPTFVTWAHNWLNGSDRSASAADAAYAAAASAYAASDAASAYAAADAAYAASDAASAYDTAHAASDAAYAASAYDTAHAASDAAYAAAASADAAEASAYAASDAASASAAAAYDTAHAAAYDTKTLFLHTIAQEAMLVK